MRAYVRPNPTLKHITESHALARGRRGESFPAFWGVFADRLEGALDEGSDAERSACERLVQCGGREVSRAYRCGIEAPALGSWCGHEYCPACSRQRAAQAAREASEGWDAHVLWIGLRVGMVAGPELPERAAVAHLRAAWSKIVQRVEGLTTFPRLESVPRAVIAPGAMHFFLRLPWGEGITGKIGKVAEDTLTRAVRQACREAGLMGVRSQVLSREAAGWQVRSALMEESRRFQDSIGYDLARLAAVRWRAPFPADASLRAASQAAVRRWIESLMAAKAQRRRPRVLGGKTSLGLSTTGSLQAAKASCPRHGGQCAVDETRVRHRHGGELLLREAGDQAPTANRTVVAKFLARVPRPAHKALASLEPAAPAVQWRLAG
jgi:hypothetical protein